MGPKPEHRNLTPTLFQGRQRLPTIIPTEPGGVEARMRISRDMTYGDLDFSSAPRFMGQRNENEPWLGNNIIPNPTDDELKDFAVRCMVTGEKFTFKTQQEFHEFKYQRYMRKYLQCVHSVDENVGRMLDYLDEKGLAENTVVIYTSDQASIWVSTVGLISTLFMKRDAACPLWFAIPRKPRWIGE